VSVGVVLVSHSAELARGLAELAAQMAPDVTIAVAGGTDDGELGTSVELVLAAVTEADTGDGAVVLYDLGSAEMTARLALELLDPEQADRLRVLDVPLVTGALAAATTAGTGADLDGVVAAAEATGPSAAGPDAGTDDGGDAAEADAVEGDAEGDAGEADDAAGVRTTLELRNPQGLHARPAALLVAALGPLDAEVTLATDDGERAAAGSLLEVVALGAAGGTSVTATATGPDAEAALARLTELVEDGFGELEAATPPATAPAAAAAGASAPSSEPTAPLPAGVLAGTGVGAGLAIGPIARLRHRDPELPPRRDDADPGRERARLDAARDAVRRALRDTAPAVGDDPTGAAAIFATHALVVDDPALLEVVERALEAGADAVWAWQDAVTAQRDRLAASASEFTAARAADVEDVGRQVLDELLGAGGADLDVPEGSVVVSETLVPSQVPALAAAGVAGLALAGGGPTSHVAVLARAHGLPAVVGLGAAVLDPPEGDTAVLDAGGGTLDLAPDDERLGDARRRRDEAEATHRQHLATAHEPVVWHDGDRVVVAANAATADEAERAAAQGAEGIGLVRTELAFLDRPDLPDEDEQVTHLRSVCTPMGADDLVIVRTLDAGGDKPVPALDLDEVRNGFLGVRGIRHSLAHPDLFATQLRAILRVAAERPVAVMFPMVTDVAEVRAAKRAVDAAAEALAAEGVPHARPASIGIMVEVPVAALAPDELLAEVDFVSVGSNDLAQYLLAADRTLDGTAHLYRSDHPAVLTVIGGLCEAARRAGRWVGVCGEMAADPEVAVRLAELGVRELSVAPAAVPAVKARLRDAARER
jgi:phosphoenolpyruvate-protein phosphotransferase/dihydroxyacetone kinase phosphotransfer subunit